MKNTIIFLSIVVFFWLNQNIFAYSQEVIFSEIQRMWTTNSSFDEWIELKNLSGNDIDLNWRVVVSEDWTPNISLQRVIKSNWYFLLERTDDNSAYQVKWDLFYSWSLENWWEVLLLKNKNWEIVDMVDWWSAWKSSGRVSMLRDENLNWVDWIVDWDPKSSFSESVNGNQDWWGMIENWNDEINWNWQNWQSWQSDQDSDGNVWNDMQDQSDTWNSGWSQGDQILDISSFDFDFQSPSYILNKEDKNQSEFFCDKSKSECKINFNFEKTFENSPDWYSKSKFYCKIKFWDLSTDQENKCNPNTVIFPIWDTRIEFEVFSKEWNVLQFKKEITIKNIESQSSQNWQNWQNWQNNSSAPVSKRKDLSIKTWIFKQKIRISQISLNESNWDFVEIMCLNCDKNFDLWWYKIYSSKNFFYFPLKKFWKYDLSEKKSIKIFLKKKCEWFDKIWDFFIKKKNFKSNNFFWTKNKGISENLDKNNLWLNQDKNNENFLDFENWKNLNPDFCTTKKTWFVSTNWSLFVMNRLWEIVDAVCWRNWKEIKWKTKDEINILLNNDLWRWECLNTTSLKKNEIFKRENFDGYNQLKSWKKFLKNDLNGAEKKLNNSWSLSWTWIAFWTWCDLQNWQNWQFWQNDILKNECEKLFSQMNIWSWNIVWENFRNSQKWQKILAVEYFDFDFQSPSYVINEDKNQSEFFCDKSKSECKINFNFEKTISNFLIQNKKDILKNKIENWWELKKYTKSDFYCKIKFWDLNTGQENKCNPNTVIFPIWDTRIEFEVFLKEWNVLQFKKEITIKNIESQNWQNGQRWQEWQFEKNKNWWKFFWDKNLNEELWDKNILWLWKFSNTDKNFFSDNEKNWVNNDEKNQWNKKNLKNKNSQNWQLSNVSFDLINKKTKFFKLKLPKEKSRVFRIKWRTLPFLMIEFKSKIWEKFETISDEKWYFKIYFDHLKWWNKNFIVNFYEINKKDFFTKISNFDFEYWFFLTDESQKNQWYNFWNNVKNNISQKNQKWQNWQNWQKWHFPKNEKEFRNQKIFLEEMQKWRKIFSKNLNFNLKNEWKSSIYKKNHSFEEEFSEEYYTKEEIEKIKKAQIFFKERQKNNLVPKKEKTETQKKIDEWFLKAVEVFWTFLKNATGVINGIFWGLKWFFK